MHKEGKNSSLLLRWLGLKRLGTQTVAEGWLYSVCHEEAAQYLRHIVSGQWDLRHLLPQDFQGLFRRKQNGNEREIGTTQVGGAWESSRVKIKL